MAIRRGKLKSNAKIYQDFACFTASKYYPRIHEVTFTFVHEAESNWRGEADGFGGRSKDDKYGNGSIFVAEDWIEFEDGFAHCGSGI